MDLKVYGAISCLVLASCSARPEQPTLNETMNRSIAPVAQILWDDISLALTDDGRMDPARLDAKKWDGLAKAAAGLADHAGALEKERGIVVAKPGVKIFNEGLEGAATAADVQHAIDADPEGFSEHAGELRAIAQEFSQAIRKRDGDHLGKLAGKLDAVCEDCHGGFWVAR